MPRIDGRKFDQLRPLTITPGFMPNAEGSCLIEFGNTKVICTATVEDRVPPFLKGKGKGWVTAEYSMLPRSGKDRNQRDTRGPSGRSQEIQRLIGRSFRSVVDLGALGERQVLLDCDVLQADGGTRTAAISGSCVALMTAFDWMIRAKMIDKLPMKELIAAVGKENLGKFFVQSKTISTVKGVDEAVFSLPEDKRELARAGLIKQASVSIK